MARKKKDISVDGEETTEEELESTEEPIEPVHETMVSEDLVKEAEVEYKPEKKSAKKNKVEVVSLSPWDRTLPPTNGKFVERIDSDSIFETEDGSLYAVPYKAEHASLKVGDSFIF